jgi:sugar lactone lactonase YvrE
MMDLTIFSELAGGLDHPEGIAQGVDGRVFAGGEAGQIYAVGPDGSVKQIASTGGFIYGVTLDGHGNVFGCDFGNAQVVEVSPDGTLQSYSRGSHAQPMRVPNFSAFDDEGNLYVTDSGEWGADDGVIYKVSPGGATVVWTDAIPRFPNGCCVSEDARSLFVIESRGRSIWRVPIARDGAPSAPELVTELPGSQPDGIALARDGTMFVGCYRPDRIYRIPSGGAPEILAEDPDGVVLNQPTNVAFVGPQLDRLAVSSLGGWSLMVADVGIAGLPLRYPTL